MTGDFGRCIIIVEWGRHPSEKTDSKSSHKGETPIEKNIIVVDEQGNQYEATWPKRAKGLVKTGRARFIDEHTICLACPPDDMEGKPMQDQRLTVSYVVEQIEKIAAQTDHLYAAINALKEMENSSVPGDMSGHAKAEALAEIVKSRETTNQQLLSVYTTMLHLAMNIDPN